MNIQGHLRKIEPWTRKWRQEINETKSAHITFTLRKETCPPVRVYVNQSIIPQSETVKYLGLHFDKRLIWIEHVTKTRKHLDLKTRELFWLIGKRSSLSLTNKIIIYQTVLKPIWTCNMGLCCSLQFSRYPAIPSEDSLSNHRCPMVCNKSYPTHGPPHPNSTNSFPGTSRKSSHSSEITPKPPYSTSPRTADVKS